MTAWKHFALLSIALLSAVSAKPNPRSLRDASGRTPLSVLTRGGVAGHPAIAHTRRDGEATLSESAYRQLITDGDNSIFSDGIFDTDSVVNTDLFDITDGIDFTDDDPACFPANAMVHVRGKGQVAMSEVTIGDQVQVSSTEFSPIYTFSHRVMHGTFSFVELFTTRGPICLTSGHYIRANRGMVAAKHVGLGAELELGNGSRAVVQKVGKVHKLGLYNPQTLAGNIVVDGFVVSTYTRAVDPAIASALLAPFRASFRLLGFDVGSGMLDYGAPNCFASLMANLAGY